MIRNPFENQKIVNTVLVICAALCLWCQHCIERDLDLCEEHIADIHMVTQHAGFYPPMGD